MTKPPANDLARAIASLRGAVEGLSADEPEAQPVRAPEIQATTSEAYPDAASAPPISAEPSEAPITTSTPTGGRPDPTRKQRKDRWARRRNEGAVWLAFELDADLVDALATAASLPETDRQNRATIAKVLLDFAFEGIRARHGNLVALGTSLTRLFTRSPAE